MIPDERAPGTWREALVSAFDGVDEAYARRARMAQAAYDAGLSFRQIGDAVGKAPATIHRIIGNQRVDGSVLDEPAGVDAVEDAA
jgi:hypothetical protein